MRAELSEVHFKSFSRVPRNYFVKTATRIKAIERSGTRISLY